LAETNINTQKLEQVIEHIDSALAMIDKTDHRQIWQTLEQVRLMLWDAVEYAEGLQALFDEPDRQRGLKQ
jgi:hypothetical protein